jgi:hypothetical protein
MANKQIIFADRLVGLSIHNGLVRMDLAVVAGTGKTKDDKDALKMEVTHQLVIPMDAFVAGVNSQQNLLKQVIERQGKRRAKADDAAAPAAG